MLPAPVDGAAPGYFGVYPAFVTDLIDPDSLGRIEVRFPFLGQDGDREVVVAFEAGNLRRPYIVGCAWNGKAALPQDPETPNNIRLLRSRANSRLEFDDDDAAPKITLRTRNGHEVVIDEGTGGVVTIQHAQGCVVRLTPTSVEVQSTLEVTVHATIVEVTAPISTFSGIVKAQTVVADSFVISPAYTPGVGNIW